VSLHSLAFLTLVDDEELLQIDRVARYFSPIDRHRAIHSELRDNEI